MSESEKAKPTHETWYLHGIPVMQVLPMTIETFSEGGKIVVRASQMARSIPRAIQDTQLEPHQPETQT